MLETEANYKGYGTLRLFKCLLLQRFACGALISCNTSLVNNSNLTNINPPTAIYI
ncbi:hypothetical protein [Rickettsia asembonensis]|uniref:hypothetical protein n=1 Tax=Rickettsia asembonensis TaxID=1068590 RepID=UPI000B00B680|nr:hypothetical protein [Rickettsia asembonensis]WCR57296.1 MAG: hypothetical protein PG979_001353 [Rickettsia asembonensis]